MSVNIHLYPSPFKTESRILRITNTLAKRGVFDRIYIVATHEQGLPEEEHLDDVRVVLRVRTTLSPDAGRVRRYLALLEWAFRIWRRLGALNVSVINAHSVPTLPIALYFKRRNGATLVYDTHEIETEQYYSTTPTKILSKVIEKACIRSVDHLVATSDGHADWYRRTYDFEDVTVVKNYPLYRGNDVPPQATALRQHCDIGADERLFVYLGLIAPGRGIELLLEAFADAGPANHLLFMGFGPQVPLVQEHAQHSATIHYHPAVAPDQVNAYLRSCDVGLCIIEDRCLSYRYTLPNKLLECLNVGVPVVVSDFPDMAAAVGSHACGWAVEPSVDALRALLRTVTAADIQRKAGGARRWAIENTWETQEEILDYLYSRIRRKTMRHAAAG